VRAPGIIHYPPKLKAGARFDGLIHITDWYPTLLSATGVSDLAAPVRGAFPLDGIDLWNALVTLTPGRDSVLIDYDPETIGGGAMIQGNLKLYVGGPHKFGTWQFPPEVGIAKGWSMEEDPQSGAEDINCTDGCVLDIVNDPYEKGTPWPASPEIMDLWYRRTEEKVIPSLRVRFSEDSPWADSFAQAMGGVWWPYGCPDMGAPVV